uniref:Uncharacterized protein n=1 Tax=Cucumis melo TaxID=3656 RepID=A0A9I9D5P6_CUCME
MTIPKTLRWEEITHNSIWKLQEVTAPAKRISTEASIIDFPDGNVEIQFNSEARYPKIREIMSSHPSMSSNARTVNSFPESFRRFESMRAAVEFTHPVPNIQYEKEEGSLSPTQSDMETRTEPIYNQLNVISSKDDNARYEEMYSKYIDI